METTVSLTSSTEMLQRFLEHENLHELEGKSIVFDKKADGFGNLLCCQGVFMTLCSFGVTLLCPIQSCCPYTLVKDYELTLDENSVVMQSAVNDCCCHIAHTKKTVPLEKIQDVEITESWIHTIFGLKQVNVQTAGMNASANGGPSAEIMASFLRDPEKARTAITLAGRLQREGMGAPGQQAMKRKQNAGTGDAVLDQLSQMTLQNTLTASEAASIKVAVLALDGDPLRKIQDGRRLWDAGRLTQQEFESLKRVIIAGLLQQVGAVCV